MNQREDTKAIRGSATPGIATSADTGAIRGATAREIAASAEAAIRDGRLDAGDALPTVRALAQTLGTSPATINAAYRILRQRGLVIAEGRRGTRVARRPPLRHPGAPPTPTAAPNGGRATQRPEPGLRDLTIGLPDPALLPSVSDAISRVDLRQRMDISGLDAPDPDLLAIGRAMFESDGVPGDAIAVVSGALDGTERVLQAHLRVGDRVVIEDPAYPPIRDILLALGLVAVPVPVDEYGLLPGPLGRALEAGADALVIVPRAQNPLGAAYDEERASAVREVLQRHLSVLVLQDDHAGAVAGAPFASVVPPDLRNWALIRATSKVLHPDMRLAFVAGDETTIARVEGRQALGPRWVSHVLQALVAEMLGDPGFGERCAGAARAYRERRRTLIEALAEHGVRGYGRTGLNVWVPVREEAPVVRALQNAGWLVAAGEHFRFATPPGIRITITTLGDDEAEQIARAIGAVERAGRPRTVY